MIVLFQACADDCPLKKKLALSEGINNGGNKNLQLVLQHCCQTSWIAILHFLLATFKPVLQQVRLLQDAQTDLLQTAVLLYATKSAVPVACFTDPRQTCFTAEWRNSRVWRDSRVNLSNQKPGGLEGISFPHSLCYSTTLFLFGVNIQRETLDWLILYRPRLPPPLLTCLGLVGKIEVLMSQCRANKAIIDQRSSDNHTITCFKL